ncbi:DUF4129 domain-containing protein [Leifsonia sp. NPDC058230]|uniref:DUF4129 domain-containing protein n=1 Tax=Leifsonia sp. NPDC058230 TaxID=3346391 RepID=UPI0036DB0F37
MRRHRTLLVCSGLLLLVVGAVALQGSPVLGGMVWVPDWSQQPPPPAQLTDGPGSASPAPVPGHVTRIDASWIVVLIAVVVLIVVAFLAWRAVRRRLRRLARDDESVVLGPLDVAELEPQPEPDAPQVRRGLDRAIDILGEPRQPRDAIEQAWLGLQEAAEESGVRRLPAETPSEFTARILSRVGADRSAARRLLDLYLRVRFGDAPVGAADVETARASLESLRASWSAEAPGGATR